MKKTLLAGLVLAFCSFSYSETSAGQVTLESEGAGQKMKSVGAQSQGSDATNVCAFPFSTGSGDTALSFCVSTNGNIVQIAAPENHPLLDTFFRSEGYGICDLNTGVNYADYAILFTVNWGTATVLSQSAKSLQVARSTDDGIWTLTQTFTLMAGKSPSIKVVMTLKNNTAVARRAFLLRFADADINDSALNNFDATRNGAAAWNSITSPNGADPAVGLVLENVGNLRFSHQGAVQNRNSGPLPCQPFSGVAPAPLVNLDGSLLMVYQPFVGPNASVTATMTYRGW